MLKYEEAGRMPRIINENIKENVCRKVDKLSLKDKVIGFTRVVFDRNEKFKCTKLVFPSSGAEVEMCSWICYAFTM
jgi:hypothetical protein